VSIKQLIQKIKVLEVVSKRIKGLRGLNEWGEDVYEESKNIARNCPVSFRKECGREGDPRAEHSGNPLVVGSRSFQDLADETEGHWQSHKELINVHELQHLAVKGV